MGGVLDLVFLVRAGVGLGPQVERVSWCATDLQRDEMIFLVVRGVCVGVPVPHDLGSLLSNGAGKVAKPDSYSAGATYDFALSPVRGTEAATAAGDLTGDTHPEVAALLSCWESDTSPNFSHWEIQVFTDGPTRLAVVVPVPDVGFRRVDSEQVSIVDRKLVVGVGLYGPDDCMGCGPSVHRSYTWRWDGHQFVRIGG